MYSLVYISSVFNDFTEEMIQDILAVSREKNKLHNITGLLLLNNYQIIQYLEGNENDVKQLFDNISKDKRHTDVYLIKTEKIEKRLFDNWSMGYKNINHLTKKELEIIKHYDLSNIKKLPSLFQKFLEIK